MATPQHHCACYIFVRRKVTCTGYSDWEFSTKMFPSRGDPIFPSDFSYCVSGPWTSLVCVSRWLHSSAWSYSRMAWRDGEGEEKWDCRSEGTALEQFGFSWNVWTESLVLACLAELLPCFSLLLLYGDEKHPFLYYKMNPTLRPVFSQVVLGFQTPSTCCHCCLKLAFMVASRGPNCSIVPLVLFTAQCH